jgi:general secretion pathway protein C
MEFFTLLHRRLWVVDLLGIMIAAVLVGDAAANLLAAALPRPATEVRHTRLPPPAPIAAADKSIDRIVGRNIFCPMCVGPAARRTCPRPYRLLAIMVAPTDWRWSVAIIRDYVTGTVGPYGMGARLGDATVAVINDMDVLLQVGHDGCELVLSLVDQGPRPPPDKCGGAPDPIPNGIRQTGAHAYEVQRVVIDRLLSGGMTPPWPRIVPESRNDALAGFRVFGIRPDSPFAALGLSNGDLLLAVNGRSIATAEAAMAAFAPLRAASHVWLEVERDGRRVRLDYAIR